MNIKDMNKKPTLTNLKDNLVERFNIDVELDEYSLNQLLAMQSTLQEKVSKLVEGNNFDYTQSDVYQKNQLFLEILEAEIIDRKALIEGAEDRAGIVMASRDMVNKVTNWMEDTAEAQSKAMLELADDIRDEMGADTAQQYQDVVKPALESLYAAMEQSREQLVASVGILTGEGGPVEPMGAPDMDMGADIEGPGDEDIPTDDEFGAAAAAAGGDEPADRTRRESVDLSRRLGTIMSEGYGKKKKKKAYEGYGNPDPYGLRPIIKKAQSQPAMRAKMLYMLEMMLKKHPEAEKQINLAIKAITDMGISGKQFK